MCASPTPIFDLRFKIKNLKIYKDTGDKNYRYEL